jgi:hypothetical protein
MNEDKLRLLARAGYGARGVIYLIVGGLAMVAAFGTGGQSTGSRGALSFLDTTAYGAAILVAIVVGLIGYAGWRALQAIFDADRHGKKPKGLAIRGGLLVSAVTHLILAGYAASLVFGGGDGGSGGGSGGGSQGVAGWLMQQPFGRWLVLAVGLAIVGAGVAQIAKGFTKKYRKHLAMPQQRMKKLDPVCQAGLIARGIVFVIVGGFFAYAGLTVDPSEAGGVSKALGWLQAQPYGSILFGLVAVGLFAFGIYSIVEAIWRRIDLSEAKSGAKQAGRQARAAAR